MLKNFFINLICISETMTIDLFFVNEYNCNCIHIQCREIEFICKESTVTLLQNINSCFYKLIKVRLVF